MELPATDVRPNQLGEATIWHRLFLPVFGVYTLGLVIWLSLGLLPTVADSLAPVHHWVQSLALSSSPLASAAARILNANQSMPGMALEAANRSSVVLAYAFSLVNLAMGVILAARRSYQLVPCLLAFALVGTAATFNKPSHAVFHIIGEPWPVKAIHFTFHIVSGVTYLWAVLLFPDGRLPRQIHLDGGRLAAVAVGVTILVAVISWRSSFVDHPEFFVVFFGVVIPIAGIAAQGLRVADPYSTPADRRSARLLGGALLPAFATGLLWLGARAAQALGVHQAHHLAVALQSVFPAVFALVPVVLFAGILRYRLWNIDWLISHALLYGALALAVSVAYIAVVALVGLGAGGSPVTVVVVLSVVAVAIDPVRGWLRSWCNRVVYGQVVTPAEAVRTMLASLDQAAPSEELTQLTRTVTEATRARRAELWLTSDNHLLRVAAYPGPADAPGRVPLTDRSEGGPDGTLEVPIIFQGEPLGSLRAELPTGSGLSSVESALIRDLAAHAGVVAHNAVLNAELARHVAALEEQLDELRASRRRLVAAQDTERKKLERDLHDGAQQSLVAALIQLRTVAAPAGPSLVDPTAHVDRTGILEVTELLGDTSAVLDELVSDQGPRVLAEHGLLGALAAAAAVTRRSGPHVDVTVAVAAGVPGDLLTTVYFCCLEAMQNASKHARASQLAVQVFQTDSLIVFEVSDNGAGFDPSVAPRGSGLGNVVQRLSVMGGDVIVESVPGSGTTVRGWLPLVAHLDPV
jgi:signal transduction histidine kinase